MSRKLIKLLIILPVFFLSCGSKNFKISSIGLMKKSTDGGTPIVFYCDNLDGINLGYDNLPTDSYWADYTITNCKGEVYHFDHSFTGWQKDDCLMINASLLSKKVYSYEQNAFANEGMLYDSIKSLEISIFTDDYKQEVIFNKVFKKFILLSDKTDFYTFQ